MICVPASASRAQWRCVWQYHAVEKENVYADLGYTDAAEMRRKSQLASEIARAIKARRLTQDGAAELPGIDQSKVSRITRGQFRGVSEAKLLELVTKLGHDVRIVVGPVPQ